MKKILYTLIWMMIAVVSASFISACSDDDNGGTPVITNVRLTDPATQDMSLTQAPLGVTLAIQGQNLGQVTKLLLNDHNVPLRATYVTNTNILVVIPDDVPTVATNPNVGNTMTVITRDGQRASYNFETLPPPAVIEAVSNEMAKEGETVTLYGKYFYFVQQVVFPGDVMGTNVTTAPDGTWLKVTVPPGVDQGGGHISVVSNSGVSSQSRRSLFNDSTGVFMNFDHLNPFGWGINGNNITKTTPGGIIKSIDGRFGMINALLNKENGWSNDKVIDITYWGKEMFPGAPVYDTTTAMADLDLRMEIAVEKPTTSLEGINLLAWINLDAEYSYAIPLGNDVKTLDGTWYTVSIPLANLATSSGKKIASYRDMLEQGTQEIRLVINNSTSTDIEGTIAIDNVRIVNHTR
jgi:hypothetical protein